MKSCLLRLAILPVLIAGYYFTLKNVWGDPSDPAVIWISTILASVFVFIGVLLLWNCIDLTRFRRALKVCQSGRPPSDGQWIVAAGAATTEDEPLISPITRTPCIGYSYRGSCLGSDAQESSDGGAAEGADEPPGGSGYMGMALCRTCVQTPAGPVFMRGYMTLLNLDSDPIDQSMVNQNLPLHLSENLPEYLEVNASDIGAAIFQAQRNALDSLGVYECNFGLKNRSGSTDPKIEEIIIRPGEEICVGGTFSEKFDGITGICSYVYRGSANDVLAKTKRSLIRTSIAAAALIVIPNTILWWVS